VQKIEENNSQMQE